MTAALRLRSFGVAFGDQVVLADVTLELATASMTVLVGPAGGGKSTLARTLAGHNDTHPSLSTWGRVDLGASDRRPVLVHQHARLYLDCVRENLVSALPNRSTLARGAQTHVVTDHLTALGLSHLVARLDDEAVALPLFHQRELAIARATIADPGVVFADEPTVGLSEAEACALVALLRREAARRAVVFITHHQQFARVAGGTTVLLASGRACAAQPTEQFFTAPAGDLAAQFVRTGGCTPVADAAPADARSAAEPARVAPAPSRYLGPRGFFWIVPGRLGGLPRPGLIDPLDHDLEGLRRLGVTTLVSLEETPTVDPAALARFAIRARHVPVEDMGVPALADALALCADLADRLAAGEVVAMHCRAGMGRTGTLLACQLIAAGHGAGAALEAVRAINPRCVQSAAQAEFLKAFAAAITDSDRAKARPIGDRQHQSQETKRWH